MACGTEDNLIEVSRSFGSKLEKSGADVVYIEEWGKHDWKFWDKQIAYLIANWLPLE